MQQIHSCPEARKYPKGTLVFLLPPIDTLYFLPGPGKLYEIEENNEVFLAITIRQKLFDYHYIISIQMDNIKEQTEGG